MINSEIADRLNKIFNYFGEYTQRVKLEEECNEYIMAGAILDDQEIADVFIVSAQIVLNNDTVRNHVFSKLERTLQRIKDGYYKDMRTVQNTESRGETSQV